MPVPGFCVVLGMTANYSGAMKSMRRTLWGCAGSSSSAMRSFTILLSPTLIFDDFLARRFPESRRKAYYLMSIHEHLPPEVKSGLTAIGWTKGVELAKIARRDRQDFDCATWLHKAREMPKDQFKHEVEKELTGRDTEPAEIVYFKLYKSQIPVIEQAMILSINR